VHWCSRRVRFNEVPKKVPKVPEKVWAALVQSQVTFNRVPGKVPEKVWEALVHKFNWVPEKVPEKVWEALVQSQVRFNRICRHLIHRNPAEVFPALGFAARFRKLCKNRTLRVFGISPKLILVSIDPPHISISARQRTRSFSGVLPGTPAPPNMEPKDWWIWSRNPAGWGPRSENHREICD